MELCHESLEDVLNNQVTANKRLPSFLHILSFLPSFLHIFSFLASYSFLRKRPP